MTGINGLNHVLSVRTVIGSDYGRGFGGLFRENGRRKGKCMEISAFGYVLPGNRDGKSAQNRAG